MILGYNRKRLFIGVNVCFQSTTFIEEIPETALFKGLCFYNTSSKRYIEFLYKLFQIKIILAKL